MTSPNNNPSGMPLPSTWQQRMLKQQEIAALQRRLMDQRQRPTKRTPKPQPEPKTANAAPSERSTLWSLGTSSSLNGGMQRVMDSGEYSDLTLLCEDQTFSVHKVVVCSQSKVLAAAMRKGFKESELNVIDLSADGAPFVSNLVKFLYTGNYPAMVDAIGVEDWSTVNEFGHAFSDLGTSSELIGNPDPRDAPLWEVWYPSHTSRAASARMEEASARKKANLKMVAAEQPPDYGLHVGMYALSNQYDIPALGAVAKEKLNVTCMLNWNPMLFIEIVPHVYESKLESNQGLRTVVLEYTRKHSNRFMKDELLKASFHGLLAAVPEFSAALLSNYMTAPPPSLGKDTNYAGFGPEGNKPHHCFCEGNCWCGHG